MFHLRSLPLLLGAGLVLAALATLPAWQLLRRSGAPPESARDLFALAFVLGVGGVAQLIWGGCADAIVHRVSTAARAFESVSARSGRTIIALLTGSFAAIWATASVVRHLRYNSMGYDLGIQDQVLWSLSRFRGFASSIEVQNYLGDHFSPIMALIAPLFWLWDDVRVLLIAQAVWLSLGVPAVWRIARSELRSSALALLLAGGYALTPAIGYAAKYDFHIITMAIPILLWAVVAWTEGHRLRWALLLLLALLVREELGLSMAGFGILALWRPHWRRLGAAFLVIGLVYSYVAVFEWIPHFRGEASDTLRRYTYLGDSGGEILSTLLREPWQPLVRQLGQTRRVLFLIQLMLPSGGLALLAPSCWVPGLANFAQNFASDNLAQASVYFHYSASYLPFVVWAGVRGAARAWRKRIDPRGRGALVLLLGWGPVGATAMDPALFQSVVPPYSQVYGLTQITDGTAFEQVRPFIRPEDSVLAAQPFAAHLSHRSAIHVFQTRQDYPLDVDWILIDFGSSRYLEDLAWMRDEVQRAILERGYRVRACAGNAIALSRVGEADVGAQREWERMVSAAEWPAHRKPR